MPRIAIPTAQTGPGTIGASAASPNSFGAQAFERIGEFGKALEITANHIQAQRDELDLTDVASKFDILIPQAQQAAIAHPNVQAETDPARRRDLLSQTFEDLLTKGRESILQDKSFSTAVQTALESHQKRMLPSAIIQLQHNDMVQQVDENNAMIDRVGAQIALDAPKIIDPGERAMRINTFQMILERSVKSGLMTSHAKEAKWNAFNQVVLENQMDYLRQTNPSLMFQQDRDGAFAKLDPMKRLKVLSDANSDQEKLHTVQERNFKRVQDAHEQDWSAQANQGRLSTFQLSEALAGKNAYITPDKAREYARINANPPDLTNGGPVQVIIQKYHSGPINRTRITQARKELRQAALEMGHPSQLIDKAMNELQSDEMSMRTVDAAEKAANVQYGLDRAKMEAEPKLPGMIGTFQKNMEEKEKAEIQMRIRKGEKPDAVLDDIKKRHEAANQAIPERSKSVLELLK